MVNRALETRDVEETLSLLTRSVIDSVPGVQFASITRRSGRMIETLAPTDPLACSLDELQYELEEGPCFDAATDQRVTFSNDLQHEPMWRRYGPRAAALGVNSQMAMALLWEGNDRVALNLYSKDLAAFNGDLEVAELFAAQAAVVMGLARRVSQLDTALESRTVIGQAVGILMERYQVDRDQAFRFLTRLSQNSNTKLREVAAELVQDREQSLNDQLSDIEELPPRPH